MSFYEVRLAPQSLRVDQAPEGPVTLSGVAAGTDTDYQIYAEMLGSSYMAPFTERIQSGAFADDLAGADVSLLVNHTGLPLARTTSGTLRLSESDRGLEVSADLVPDDPDVARLVPKMRRGDMDKMSIGFYVMDDDWSDDYTVRTIKRVSLDKGDVSVVTHPANQATSAVVRSLPIPPIVAQDSGVKRLNREGIGYTQKYRKALERIGGVL